LRDDIPGILYPGHWGFFGGHIESGETPEQAVVREVYEEISYSIERATEFGRYDDECACRYVYHSPLTVSLDRLVLNEGWDFGLIDAEAIARGSAYSAKSGGFHPLGKIHQKILLDFLAAGLH
jgi:8-oxo-dGTP pyrophosphatase MutT (NUDIX family)